MITSKDNKLIKLVSQIKQKKYSRQEKLCVVETYKVVSELEKRKRIIQVLVTENSYSLVKNLKCPIDIISDSICKYLSDTVSSDGVIAIAKIENNNSFDYNRCLVLDNIQDPSNIGAIIRSACAFGFKKIIAINSVYPYTYKCIRSSMGYIFDIDYEEMNYIDLLDLKKSKNINFYVADMDGVILDDIQVPSGNLAIVIGNEGQGVSINLRELADTIVSIPMQNCVESLNASVCAGILMYKLKR